MQRKTLLLISGTAIAAAASGLLIGATLLAPRSNTPVAPAAAPQAPEGPEHAEEGRIELSPERIRAAGIVVAPVAASSLQGEIIAQANVAAAPTGQAVLAARADGVVTRLSRRLGDYVRAGEAVASIESRDASQIASERASAAARVTAARSAFTREQRLFQERITARQDLEAAQATLAQAQAELTRTTAAAAAARISPDGRSVAVVSPISGRVTAAPAVLGSFVTAGAELFRVTNPSLIQLQAAVPVSDARRLQAGDQATVEAPDGDFVTGVVRSLAPAVDPESRTTTVVLDVTSGVEAMQPGQSLRVRIRPRGEGATQGIVVPEEAIQTVEGRDVLFVRTGQGFEVRQVRLGQRGGGQVQVLEGVRANEGIAIRNTFLLKAEAGRGEAEH